jgi:hypothetical protein
MKMRIEVTCENEAFTENCGLELSRVLQETAHKMPASAMMRDQKVPLRDVNGNLCGFYVFEESSK